MYEATEINETGLKRTANVSVQLFYIFVRFANYAERVQYSYVTSYAPLCVELTYLLTYQIIKETRN